MSRGGGVLFGYGIDLGWDGEFTGRLGDVLGEQGIDDLDTEDVTRRLAAEGLEVIFERYGYEYRGVVMLAKDSAQEAFTWLLNMTVPDTRPVPQWRRELQQALDLLCWDDAELGDPSWLACALYG